MRLTWDVSCATAYTVNASSDGVVWSHAYSTQAGDGGVDDLQVGAVGRYVQVVGLTRCGQRGYSLQEVEVFGTVDSATNTSGAAADKTPPTTPTAVKGTAAGSSASVSWRASTDNIKVVGYDLYRDGTLLRTVDGATTSVTLTDLAPNSRYRLAVRAGTRRVTPRLSATQPN